MFSRLFKKQNTPETKTELVKVIDLWGCVESSFLYSRMAWQEIFNLYAKEGGDISNLSDLLADLKYFTEDFEGNENFCVRLEINKHGHTDYIRESYDIVDFMTFRSYVDISLNINYDKTEKKITITRLVGIKK